MTLTHHPPTHTHPYSFMQERLEFELSNTIDLVHTEK